LHGNFHSDKYIVFGFRLNVHIQLLDLEIDLSGNGVNDRNFEMQARVTDAVKLSEALDYDSCLLLNGEKAGVQKKQS
jgi:hypothetical protein